MAKIPFEDNVIDIPVHATGYLVGNGSVFNLRLSTDPLFYATITLQNVTDGSNYRISQHDSPYTELATGTQSGTGDIEITNIPAYSNPMLMDITIRNFNGTTNKYKEYLTNASLVKSGALVYVVQSIDPTA